MDSSSRAREERELSPKTKPDGRGVVVVLDGERRADRGAYDTRHSSVRCRAQTDDDQVSENAVQCRVEPPYPLVKRDREGERDEDVGRRRRPKPDRFGSEVVQRCRTVKEALWVKCECGSV